CNPTSSKFIHTWLRFGEIMRGSLSTMRFFPDLTAFQQVYPDGNFIDWKIYQSVAAELYAHDLERLC
ncbi:YdiL family protein, partial [Escherichia coli]|nr:YdiL family protein [Escherichia coli]